MLETFMCCFELETGGRFLGWLGIFTSAVPIFLTIIGFVMGSYIVSAIMFLFSSLRSNNFSRYKREIDNIELLDNGFMKNVSEMAKQISFNEYGSLATFLGITVILTIFIYVIFCVLLCVRWWANIRLMKGTKNRDHKEVFKYIIFDLVYTSLYGIGSLITLKPACIVYELWLIYLSLCTFSLYKKLENESKRGISTSIELYQLPTTDPIVGDPNYLMTQNIPQPQPGGYSQPQTYPQVPAYQKPQANQQPQENSKLAERKKVPSYNSVPSTSRYE